MLKKLAHTIIPLLFVIALIGPSIFQLCASETTSIVLTITEEEVKEKILIDTHYFSQAIDYLPKKSINSAYIEKGYNYDSDILLPPPEYLG